MDPRLDPGEDIGEIQPKMATTLDLSSDEAGFA